MQIRQKGRCPWNMLASWILVTLLGSIAGYPQSSDVIYEGARLIVGDASAPIQNGAFVVAEDASLRLAKRLHQSARRSRSCRSDRQDRHAYDEQHPRPSGL